MNPRFRIPADILRSLFTAHPWAALALLGVLMGCSSPRDGALEQFSRWHDNARAQAQAFAESQRAASGGAEDSFALRAAGFAREHPMAVAAIAGVAVVAGPRRLIRWAGVLLPMLLRLRR